MAERTITIDMQAYRLLAAQRQGRESFSQVIKRRLRPRNTAAALLADLDRVALDTSTLDHLDQVVKDRGRSMASSPTWG